MSFMACQIIIIRLFIQQLSQFNIKENFKAALWDLWDGNSLVIGGFPSQRVSDTESVSISWHHRVGCTVHVHYRSYGVVAPQLYQAPVPLSIFRSNSKFDENSKHSSVKYTRPITTIFCTRHDSVTVVTCAKYRCDRSNIFETRAFWIFIEFRIRSKYA